MKESDDLYPCCMKEEYGNKASTELQTWRTIANGSDASIEERITAIKLALASTVTTHMIYDDDNTVVVYPDSKFPNRCTIEQALSGILHRYQRECESRERQKGEYNMLYKLDGSPCPYCKHPHPDVNSL